MKNMIIRTLTKTSMKVKKHSSEILLVTGLVGVVAGTIAASKASTKLSNILEENKNRLEVLNEAVENEELKDRYNQEDYKKDVAIVYTQTALKVAKLYLPAVAITSASIIAILASHNILKKRHVALASAFSLLNENFKGYKARVEERFGKEVEREIRYGIKSKEIEETIIDEKGKEKKVKKTLKETDDLSKYSSLARIFSPNTTNACSNDTLHALSYLKSMENYFNNLLQIKGHLFLNDVYENLGFDKTKEGQILGWWYDKKNASTDNYVDLGIMDIREEDVFLEDGIILDFNVDGNIWEKL